MYLTYDMAVDELLKAVAARGERYIYPEDQRLSDGLCQYVLWDRTPACIVGQVFSQLGVDISPLHGRVCSPERAAEIVGIALDKDAADLLTYAQGQQDKGVTWGESVSYALRSVEQEILNA